MGRVRGGLRFWGAGRWPETLLLSLFGFIRVRRRMVIDCAVAGRGWFGGALRLCDVYV